MRTRYRQAGVVAALCGAVLVVSGGGSASAAGPIVTLEDGVNGCNGVVTTPGSENTSKTLAGGSMQPGGTAVFEIQYPVEAEHVGDTFTITDCVFVDGKAVEKYTIAFVPNNTAYTLSYAITIPEGTPLGARYCNYAKTTGGPSSPQASNRKANPACFFVGGSLRVEKHDEAGALLPGATFEVECDPGEALVPPVVVDGLDEDGVAQTGVIGVNAPEGTECVVTEVAAPAGYELAEESSRTLTVPRGSEAAVEVFVNLPSSTSTPTPSVSPTSDGPVVEPGDPEPTISPTVAGIRHTKAPTALPATGTTTGPLVAFGLGLLLLGGVLVARGRYQPQH